MASLSAVNGMLTLPQVDPVESEESSKLARATTLEKAVTPIAAEVDMDTQAKKVRTIIMSLIVPENGKVYHALRHGCAPGYPPRRFSAEQCIQDAYISRVGGVLKKLHCSFDMYKKILADSFDTMYTNSKRVYKFEWERGTHR